MADRIGVPVKVIDGVRWGQLNLIAESHLICGEIVREKNQSFTLAGQHRVRLYSFKKNVHWRIPDGISLDVTGVPPANPPRRHQQNY
jgi:hypothetical protein